MLALVCWPMPHRYSCFSEMVKDVPKKGFEHVHYCSVPAETLRLDEFITPGSLGVVVCPVVSRMTDDKSLLG